MKKCILIIGIFLLTITSLLATVYTGSELVSLRSTGNYTELKVATTQLLADPNVTEYKKRIFIEFALYADIGLNTVSTTEEITNKYNQYFTDLNIERNTDSNDKLINIFFNNKRFADVIQLSETLPIGPKGYLVAGVAYYHSGDFVNALRCYISAEDWPRATMVAIQAGDKENYYTYCSKAFNVTGFKTAASAINAVNELLSIDFTGTNITEADIKNLLITINRKYSAKLITDERVAWEPFIQLIRTTLDTYN